MQKRNVKALDLAASSIAATTVVAGKGVRALLRRVAPASGETARESGAAPRKSAAAPGVDLPSADVGDAAMELLLQESTKLQRREHSMLEQVRAAEAKVFLATGIPRSPPAPL